MKRMFALLLALCLLLSLGAGSACAENAPTVQSAEEFQALLQKAEGGDAAAMALVGMVYYRGSYKAGVSRDFGRALNWFELAAEGGRTDVLMHIATIYEKGSAGNRNPERAYEYYRKAADAGIPGAEEKLADPAFASFRWKENSVKLMGSLGSYEKIANRDIMPFYPDTPLVDCSLITMELVMLEYTGWPFGLYALYGQDTTGAWKELGRFQIEKYQADGEVRSYQFPLDTPQTLTGLAVVIIEDGMEFTLRHSADYYAEKTAVSTYSAELRAPDFTPSAEQFPLITSRVATAAYVNPFPGG